MESLTISLKEIFRKGILNSKIQSICQFGDAEYLICTKNQVFHFSAFKDSSNNLVPLNYSFKTCIFIKDLNIICAIGSSLPNIVFISIRYGFPLINEAYRLSSTLYDTIQYSPKSRKLIVSGDSVEIFDFVVEWKLFEIDPLITLINKLSFSCERMTSNVYLDELRQILIIPSLFGISTVNLTNLNGSPNYNLNHNVNTYQLGNIPFQTMAFYNSKKISKKTSLSNIPFKNLLTTNSNGEMSLWNSSSLKKLHPIQNFRKLNEAAILCEFIDNEFCLFVTENKPNYFVILFDIKTGKNIKLTSFDTKVIKMTVISKQSVSFLTENFYVLYQLNIPWHLFSKTASNAISIRRYPIFYNTSPLKAARVTTLCADGIISIFSPDVHFLLTELGTTCSSRIIDFIYDRSSSLRIRDKILSIQNNNDNDILQDTSNINLNLNLATSNKNSISNSETSNYLNSNLATSNFEKSKFVSFHFNNDNQQTTSTNNNQKVNFLQSLLEIKKKQQPTKNDELGERFIILLDDGSLQIFKSDNDSFTLSQTINNMNLCSISMTYINDESTNSNTPVFIGFNKNGKLLSFRYSDFELLSRTGIDTSSTKQAQYPLFVCLHHQSNTIYAIYESEILTIDSFTKKVIQTESLNSKPKFASLEDDLLLIASENRTIKLRHLNGRHHFQEESIKLLENVTFAIVQYETYIIVTDEKTVRIGRTFENCAIFEFPFKIFAAGFINEDLDVALALDFEIMVVRRANWYPFIGRPFVCQCDSSDPKGERIINSLRDKAVLYNIASEEGESEGEIEELKQLPLSKSKFSLHKSSPALIKVKGKNRVMQKQGRMSGNGWKSGDAIESEAAVTVGRKMRLPELRSREDMMNDRKFQELFKDIGSSFETSPRKKRQAGSEERAAEASASPAADENESEGGGEERTTPRKKVKRKRRVARVKCDEGESEVTAANEKVVMTEEEEVKDDRGDEKTSEGETSPAKIRPKPPSGLREQSPRARSKGGARRSGTEIEMEKEPEGSIDQRWDSEGACRDRGEEGIGRREAHGEAEIVIEKVAAGTENELASASASGSQRGGGVGRPVNEEGSGDNEDSSGKDSETRSGDSSSPPEEDGRAAKQPLAASSECGLQAECAKCQVNKKSSTIKDKSKTGNHFLSPCKHSQLTSSSPDLVLLQARLGLVKLTVAPSAAHDSSSNSSSQKHLPLITVHLIQKSPNRARSEYCLVRPVGQPTLNGNDAGSSGRQRFPFGVQVERLVASRGIEGGCCESYGSAGAEKAGALSVRPLLANREAPRRQAEGGRRKAPVVPRRCDRRPLGDVELAIQVFRPITYKK